MRYRVLCAKVQDRVARILYPLYGQVSLWDGGVEGLAAAFMRTPRSHPVRQILDKLRPEIEPIITEANYKYSEYEKQLQEEGVSQSDFVNKYLLDRGIDQWRIIRDIEEQFPELRHSVEASPGWLVDAQRQFSISPDMGPLDVRTIDQYDDISRYAEFYKRLDDLIKYSNPGNGLYGT